MRHSVWTSVDVRLEIIKKYDLCSKLFDQTMHGVTQAVNTAVMNTNLDFFSPLAWV